MDYQFPEKPISIMQGFRMSNPRRTAEWSEDLQLLAPDGQIHEVSCVAGEAILLPVTNGMLSTQTKASHYLLKRPTGDLSFESQVAIVKYLIKEQ